MTTPAINKTDQVFLPNQLKYAGAVISTTGVCEFVDRQFRPASRKNPLRADFTRAPSDWTHTWWRHHVVSGTVRSTDGVWEQSPWPISAAVEPVNFPVWPYALDQRLWVSAASRAKNQHVDLGVMLAEAGKTAEQIGDTARRFASGLRSLQKSLTPKGMAKLAKDLKALAKDPKRRVDAGNAVINEYLGFCYGWQPTVSDISGLMKTVYDLQNKGQKPQFSVRATVKDLDKYTLDRTNNVVREKLRGDATFKGSIQLVFSSFDPDVSFAAQLGAYNPLASAYELIPYSFVLDWFLPIGDWLNSLDGFVGKRFKEGSLSRKITLSAKSDGQIITGPTWTRFEQERQGRLEAGQFVRTAFTSLPTLIPPPSLRNPLSLDHVAKGLALATQALQGWDRGIGFLRI